MMKKDEILLELGENYNFLGESLFLLTALMAYESAFGAEGKEKVAETSRNKKKRPAEQGTRRTLFV